MQCEGPALAGPSSFPSFCSNPPGWPKEPIGADAS